MASRKLLSICHGGGFLYISVVNFCCLYQESKIVLWISNQFLSTRTLFSSLALNISLSAISDSKLKWTEHPLCWNDFKYIRSYALRMKGGLKVPLISLILIGFVCASIIILAYVKSPFLSYWTSSQDRVFQISPGLA